MKKVGIVTITDGSNYGNRLQNYAMQKLLESIGFQVETIKRKTDRDKLGVGKLIQELKYIVKRVLQIPCDREQRKRQKRFDIFNDKYISFSPYTLYDNIAPKNFADKYDYFVVGSDQVWNARIEIVKQDIKNYLAFFAHPEQRIAYAASFGTDDILPEFEALYKKELPKYKAISVREISGASIVKELCGRYDTEVVLDPTMMLSAEEWRKIEKKPQYIEGKKYIVTYFLGGRSHKISSYIDDVAKMYQANIINLEIEFLRDDRINSRKMFETSPDEFVWLIDHAECVLTDSFHATVFSILFQKPFCTFERPIVEEGNRMGSRIETLLGKFGLLEQYDTIENPKQIPAIYELHHIESVLQRERELSMKYLRKAFDLDL